MKRKQLLTSILAFLLLLPSCAAPQKGPTAHLKSDLNYLCEEGEGRLTGTEGNQRAQDYIAQQFQLSELAFLEGKDSYLFPCTQEVFDPAAQDQVLTATYADGSKKEFRCGEDFYPCLGRNAFSGEVTTDPADPELASKVLLSPAFLQTEVQPVASVLCQELVTANSVMGASSSLLKVDNNLYAQLEGCTYLSLSSGLTTSQEQVHNVVGVLPGTDRSQTILLTAHFDHVGSYGDTVFPGAVDNAAGTAALLEPARLLSGDEEPPPVDVVFCAFNGEDNGLRGSAALAEAGLPYDRCNVINLDTIGWAGTPVVSISDNCMPLAEALRSSLESAGLTVEVAFGGNSDHNTFHLLGIPAVNVGSAETGADGSVMSDLLHTPADTADQVDLEKVAAVAAALADYVHAGILVEAAEDSFENMDAQWAAEERLWALANDHAKKLAEELDLNRDQTVWFQVGDAIFLAYDISPLAGLDAVAAYDPAIHLPERLGDYTFHALFFGLSKDLSQQDGRTMSLVRAYAPSDVPLETPVSKNELDLPFGPQSMLTLEYQNEEGRCLEVTLLSPEEDADSGGRMGRDYYDYKPADGLDGVWKAYLSPQVYGEERGGNPTQLRVEGLACVIELNFQRWENGSALVDTWTEADLEELIDLVKAHWDELAAIQPIYY